MDPLTEDDKESYENQKLCHICEKEFFTDNDNKEMRKLAIIVTIQENIEAVHIVSVI